MNLLLYDSCAYTQDDIMYCLSEMGVAYKNILYKLSDLSEDDFFTRSLKRILFEGNFDAVFSVNYFPVIAKVCNALHITYISWSYDSPLNIPDMETTLGFSTNYVFFFDRAEYEKYANMGFKTVYHMPLGINVTRLSRLTCTKKDFHKYHADISLVGQLYESSLPALLAPLSDYEKGYINAITEAQLHIYGYNFIEDLLTDRLMKQINQRYRDIGQNTVSLEKYGLAGVIAKQVTRMERMLLLNTLGEYFQVKLYSSQWEPSLENVGYSGTVDYYTQMPNVFRASGINLNPTLKCIKSGIPLRALDILGSGGFLLSNFQPELAENFENGSEVVMYDSLENAIELADFYLAHEDLRKSISQRGLQKAAEHFSYADRLKSIFRICRLS